MEGEPFNRTGLNEKLKRYEKKNMTKEKYDKQTN